MVSKKLLGCWAFVDACLLAAGIVTLIISLVWREPNVLRHLILSNTDMIAGLVLAGAFLVTWAISIGGILLPNRVTFGLVVLNWLLILDAVGVLIIGGFVWFSTLLERSEYHAAFAVLDDQAKIAVQDQLKCCGYFNASDYAVVGGQFCSNETFIQVTNNATGNFCVTPITAEADYTLNNIFTTIFGFMAILILLFLVTTCVINKRAEAGRLRKIDEKRGGEPTGGFV